MKIAFNPSTVAALITPPNNKDITFDLRGRNIFARGVKFLGTDTNTWRDIKINNVSIGSNILDLRNGSNTTLTNTNGVVTINSTWRPVVDNLTSDSTTSSLSAKQGKVLKSLIDGKSNSGHTHDDRYLKLTGGTMASNALITFADSGSWGTDKGPQGARGGLYWTGQSDYAKLYAEETVGDNLDLVIQFGDDNSNGLSIRNKANTQTSYISAGGVITTGTFKGNLDWSYITNKPSSYTPSAHTHAWNSLTHSSTTENQAILTNGKANGWKLYTLNISRWDNAANNAHSHANKSVLDGITSALVNNWNVAYTFVNTITGTDTDKVINKWDEIVNFLAGITEDNKLNTLLNSKLSVYKLADNTNVGAIKNNGIYYSTSDASSGTLVNSPFNTGFALINMTSLDNGDDLRRSRLAFNAYGEIKVSDDRDLANTAETWYNVLTSKNSGISGSTIKLNGTSITVYSSSTADGRYVKKSGDTMRGALNFANGTWNKVGDDVYMGDHNIGGQLCIMGANGTTGLSFHKYGDASIRKSITFDGNTLYMNGSCDYATLSNLTNLLSINTVPNKTAATSIGSWSPISGRYVFHQKWTDTSTGGDSADFGIYLDGNLTANMVLDGYYNSLLGFRVIGATSGFLKANGTIDNSTYLTSHLSLSNYYTKSEVDTKLNSKLNYRLFWERTNIDLNSITEAWHTYEVNNGTGTANTPTNASWHLAVLWGTGDTDYAVLLCTAYTSNYSLYLRHKIAGKWNNWIQLATTTDIPSSLKNPHALTISLNGTSQGPYDGSAAKNINITPGSIGAATSGHNHDNRYLKLTGGTMQLGEGLKFHADDNYFGTDSDARIISLLDGNDKICDGGLIIDERATLDGKEYVTELLRIRDSEFKWKGSNILHSGNSNINGNTITINGSSLTVSKSDHTHSWTSITDKLVAGNEFNIVNAGFNAGMWFNYLPINDRSKTATITGYHFGNGATGYTSINASGFIKKGSSSSYVLLGDGGHKAISDFATSRHTHLYIATTSFNGLVEGTVATYKTNIHSTLSGMTGIGKHIVVSDSIIGNWSNNSASHTSSSVSSIISINGGYDGRTYGQFLVSSWNYGLGLLKYNNGSFQNIKWFSTVDHTHSYLPLSGGTMSNTNKVTNLNADLLDGYHATCGTNKPWGTIPVIHPNGWMDVGKHFEFHYDNTTGSDYSTLLRCTGNYGNVVNLPSASGTLALTSQIPNVTNYYWANIKISNASNSNTAPTFGSAIINTRLSIASSTLTKTNPTSLQLVINGPSLDSSVTPGLKDWPGIGFHMPGRTWGSLIFNGNITAINSDYNGYVNYYGAGFRKSGSSDSYVLLGGGGHKLESSLNVANADKLDGVHLSGIFTAFGNNAHNITATIGGVTKSFLVNWAADSDKLDGYHENSFLRYRETTSIDLEATLWNLIGIKLYNNALPDNLTGVYNYGSVISLPCTSTRFEIYASHLSSNGNGLYYRSGWGSDKKTWLKFIDSSNIGSQSVNYANSAGNADKLDGIHANGLLTALSNSNNGISITVGGTTKSVSNISVNYASSAGSATKVIVNLHTTNDTNYPLVWSNLANSSTITENQLYKSWSDLYYNPKNKRLTVGGSVVASSFVKRGGTSLQLLRADGGIAAFNWSGQSGLPSWLWGGNNEHSYYVYNPSNFRVAYATSAGSADTALYLRSLGNLNCQTGRTLNYGDVYTYNTYDGNTGSPTTFTSVIGFGRGIAGTVEIAGGWDNTNLYWRSLRDCCENWHSWRTVLDSSNYTEFINNYYWANVKISTSSSTTTSPTVSNLTATSSIRMGNIYLLNTNEINSASGIHLNYQNSGNISLCYGGGKVGIGTTSPTYKLDVNGLIRASGFHHSSMNSDNYILLAGGGYKSFGGDSSHPVFLGYLNLDHGSDGTVSSSFYCLGYSVPFTYTRGGNYCKISIPDTTHQAFYIKAATASVNYSGGGMDTWTGNHRGAGAWWLHCYAPSSNEVRVKGFHLKDTNNDSWWGGNPLWSDRSGVNRITVCIFGYVTFR